MSGQETSESGTSQAPASNWKWSDELDGYTLGTAEEERKRAKGWMDTAGQEAKNTDYYRGLITKIGELLGQEAKTSDDGSIQDSVLCIKVPDLVKRRFDEARSALERIAYTARNLHNYVNPETDGFKILISDIREAAVHGSMALGSELKFERDAALHPAAHASAPTGFKCSDCTIDLEPCPRCYQAWWTAKHPNVRFS
jgi:hypothetical protein